jgi:hypothetical protein
MTENETYFAKLRQATAKRLETEEMQKKHAEANHARAKELFCERLLHFTDYQMQLLLDKSKTEESHSLYNSDYPNLVFGYDGSWFRELPSACEEKIRRHIAEKYNAKEVYYGPDEVTASYHRGYYQGAYFGLKLDPQNESVRVHIGQTKK